MSKKEQGPVPISSKGMNLGSIMIYVVLASALALLAYTWFNRSKGAAGIEYTKIPKEMQINYVPSDYEFDFDDDNAIAILSNPRRYRREFSELIYDYNMSLLSHIAKRMDLADTLKMQLEPEYRKHHSYLSQLYFDDFVSLRDSSSNFYEAWYNNESTSVVEVMNEVASKYTCFLVNQVMMTLLESQGGKLYGKGANVNDPCGIAMAEGLRPLIERLQQTAAINDFSSSKGMIQEKVESVIAELATMEVRDKKGLNKQLQTKVWGYSVSSTDMEISAMSVMKIGFKLNQYFDISVSTKDKTVWVTLTEPTVLSHEVYPSIDKLDIGWMRELGKEDFNKNINILRREFRRDAIQSQIFDKAKTQADELMQMMLDPIVKTIGRDYQVKVRFKKSPDNKLPAEEELSIPSQPQNSSAAKLTPPDGKN